MYGGYARKGFWGELLFGVGSEGGGIPDFLFWRLRFLWLLCWCCSYVKIVVVGAVVGAVAGFDFLLGFADGVGYFPLLSRHCSECQI